VATVATGLEEDTAELLEILARTADGMVAIGPGLRIVGWNDAAAQLLGYTAEEIMGKPCFEVLGWHDRCGNAVCDADCPACARSSRDELIETREVMGRSRSGQAVWLSVSTVVPPARMRGDCQMIHFIREGGLAPQVERILVERLQGSAAGSAAAHGPDGQEPEAFRTLTIREREVLRLLSEGMDTRDIAAHLVVSPMTVRNHIQHILAKLEVHSRVEAVALALRNPVRDRGSD